jgi:hypothetical protein
MIRLASLLCLLGTPLSAQLKISELLLDPPGANGANQIVELVNVGATSVTPGPNWTLCARPLYPPLPQIAVPAGGVVRLHIGVVGTDSATDWFVPGIPVLALDGELAIYSTNIAFADPTQMVDFVSWGNGAASPFNSRMSTAISAQLWTSATAHVTLPAEGPQTAAWLGGGAGVGPGAWFIDGTPTLGAPNNPAVFEAFAFGCAGSAGEPALSEVPLGSRPWLGTTFQMGVTNVPGPTSLGFLVLGFTETPPQDLALLGLPAGCRSYLSPDLLVLAVGSGQLAFSLGLPASPALEGTRMVAQAAVSDPSLAVPVQFVVSRPARLTIGLR